MAWFTKNDRGCMNPLPIYFAIVRINPIDQVSISERLMGMRRPPRSACGCSCKNLWPFGPIVPYIYPGSIRCERRVVFEEFNLAVGVDPDAIHGRGLIEMDCNTLIPALTFLQLAPRQQLVLEDNNTYSRGLTNRV